MKSFGCGVGFVNVVTPLSARAAWATGSFSRCPSLNEDLLIARWNGRSWTRVPPPAHFADDDTSDGEAIAALSASYSWTFIHRGDHSFGLLYQSGRWRTFQLADNSEFFSAMAFSMSNVWAFGLIIGGVDPSTPYAIHFNGQAWKQVTLPIIPSNAAFSGPRDIWVVGDSKLAHWTGKWHVIPFPRLNDNLGNAVLLNAVVPDGAGGAWVTVCAAGMLLHWTGRAWVKIKAPSGFAPGPLAHDESGGLWVTAVNTPSCDDFGNCLYDMIRYGRAHGWSKPVSIGGTMPNTVRLIPGTHSLWAGGGGPNFGDAEILKFGP